MIKGKQDWFQRRVLFQAPGAYTVWILQALLTGSSGTVLISPGCHRSAVLSGLLFIDESF